MTFSTAQEPVPEGKDLSAAPLDTPAPETSVPPAGDVEQPEAAPEIHGTETESGTEPVKAHTPGKVTIYAVPPMGTLTVPPLDGEGDPVVIDRHGVEVDEVIAERARAAARLAGFTIREE